MSEDIDTVAPEFRTVLFVICAVLGLVAVASVVPPLTGTGYDRPTGESDSFETIGEEPAGDETGSPDTIEQNRSDDPATDQEPSTNDSQEQPPDDDDDESVALAITLDSQQPTPGTSVQITVSRADTGDPAQGATVAANGQRVGTTDEDGRLQATVPFVEELTLTASMPTQTEASSVDGAAGRSTGLSQTGRTTVKTDSEIQLRIDGQLGPAGDVTINSTIGTEPVTLRDATVSLDGQSVGATDENGTVETTIPEDASTVTITAKRGAISASETIDLTELSASADGLFPVAGGRTDFSAAVDSLDTNGQVYVLSGAHGNISDRDDLVSVLESKGRSPTDASTELEDGSTVGLAYPIASKATIVVTVGTHAEPVVVENLYRNLAGIVLGTMSFGFGVFITYVRVLGRSPGRDLHLARNWTFDLTFSLGAFMFDLASKVPLGQMLSGTASLFVSGTAGAIRAMATLRLPSPSAPSLSWPSLSLPSLSLPSLSLPTFSLGSVMTGRSDGTETATNTDRPAESRMGSMRNVDESTEEIELSNRELIWAAWHELARRAGVRRVETTTPGAVARQARAQTDLPVGAVDVVTEAVRAIEYGGAEPTEERVEIVLDAIADIRAAGGESE